MGILLGILHGERLSILPQSKKDYWDRKKGYWDNFFSDTDCNEMQFLGGDYLIVLRIV